MTFSASAVYSALTSTAKKTNVCRSVLGHEPKSAPVSLPALALWWNEPMRGLPGQSGLAAVTVGLGFRGRFYQAKMLEHPEDNIEAGLLLNTEKLCAAWAAGFTGGGVLRCIDLLGIEGQVLEAVPGYITHENTVYRVAEITIPCIIDDLWPEAP